MKNIKIPLIVLFLLLLTQYSVAESEHLDMDKVDKLTDFVITKYNSLSYKDIWNNFDEHVKKSEGFDEFEKVINNLHDMFGNVKDYTFIAKNSNDIVFVINKNNIERNLRFNLYTFYYRTNFDKIEGYIEIIVSKNNSVYQLRGFRLFTLSRVE